MTVTGKVAVLPDDLKNSSDELFSGVSTMEKYQGALLNYAAYLALLKERNDGGAERFYQLALAELKSLGVNPNNIPPAQEVA